jgi:hypothetical protein
MRDVQSIEARPLPRRQQVGQGFNAQIQGSQADQPIDMAETEGFALLHVHRRGQRVLDAGADQYDSFMRCPRLPLAQER